MKKILLSLLFFVAAVSFANAQLKVLVVDADDAVYELDGMAYDALINSGYTIDTVLEADYVANIDADENYLSQYNVVLWFAGNDGVQPNLWDVSDTTGGHPENARFTQPLIKYMKNGGILWVDGLDVLWDVFEYAGDTWTEGTFMYDVMGISGYLSQSKSDDGGLGVPFYLKSADNDVTTLDSLKWTWSSLWYADGLGITPSAKALYVMADKNSDGTDYPLAGQVTALVNYNFIYSGFRFGKLDNQDRADAIVKEMLDAVANGVISDQPSPDIDNYIVSEEVTGIADANINVSVWPNPATDYVVIGVTDKANITMSDMTGKVVLQKEINGKENIDLSGYAKGIYNIRVKTANGIITKKLIVR